jgi:mannose-1-phosphate guanylyltransferase/mannose-6-phosphate isomerase
MGDAVLVTDKSQAQRVKEAVDAQKFKGLSQAIQLPRNYRPWGWYESLVIGSRFQVKRIVVDPGAALSLQSHHHRSEHWIVFEGTAKVTVEETDQRKPVRLHPPWFRPLYRKPRQGADDIDRGPERQLSGRG